MTSYGSGATHGAHLTAFTSKLPFYNLFEFWRVQTVTDTKTSPMLIFFRILELVVSCVVLFLLGLGHEFLKSVQISHGNASSLDATSRTVTHHILIKKLVHYPKKIAKDQP
ncbi:uncharacterized protein LOC101243079 isoform X1 [Ciona intestinalis]